MGIILKIIEMRFSKALHLKRQKWAGMVSQQVAVLAAKADVLTSILRSHMM